MKNILYKIKRKSQKITLDIVGSKAIPTNYRGDDIFLVSYPKSGNTWLRFLIANTLVLHYNIPREVNFFSIHEIIPDIHMSRNISDRGFFQDYHLPRIIKSHAHYNIYYNRVILLVRHPINVLFSYYNFCLQRKFIPATWTFSDFIRDRQKGVIAWLEHTQSWYRFLSDRQIIKVLRYEDLVVNPQASLGECMDLLGIKVSSNTLDEAVKLSSKQAMKSSEEKHLSTYLINNQAVEFVNHHQNKEIALSDKEHIENITQNIIQQLRF